MWVHSNSASLRPRDNWLYLTLFNSVTYIYKYIYGGGYPFTILLRAPQMVCAWRWSGPGVCSCDTKLRVKLLIIVCNWFNWKWKIVLAVGCIPPQPHLHIHSLMVISSSRVKYWSVRRGFFHNTSFFCCSLFFCFYSCKIVFIWAQIKKHYLLYIGCCCFHLPALAAPPHRTVSELARHRPSWHSAILFTGSCWEGRQAFSTAEPNAATTNILHIQTCLHCDIPAVQPVFSCCRVLQITANPVKPNMT